MTSTSTCSPSASTSGPAATSRPSRSSTTPTSRRTARRTTRSPRSATRRPRAAAIVWDERLDALGARHPRRRPGLRRPRRVPVRGPRPGRRRSRRGRRARRSRPGRRADRARAGLPVRGRAGPARLPRARRPRRGSRGLGAAPAPRRPGPRRAPSAPPARAADGRPHGRRHRPDRRDRRAVHARARALAEVERIVGMARRPFDPAAHGWKRPSTAGATCSTARAVDGLVADADVVVHLAFIIVTASSESRDDQPRGLAQRLRGGRRRPAQATRLHVFGRRLRLPRGPRAADRGHPGARPRAPPLLRPQGRRRGRAGEALEGAEPTPTSSDRASSPAPTRPLLIDPSRAGPSGCPARCARARPVPISGRCCPTPACPSSSSTTTTSPPRCAPRPRPRQAGRLQPRRPRARSR